MRAVLAAGVVAGAGLVASHALGQTVPIPGVTTLTVPTVTLPVPTPTLPVPTPTVSTPSTPAPSPAPTAPTSSTPAQTVAAVANTAAGGASGGAGATAPSSSAQPTRTSPTWISTKGPRDRRAAILGFRLQRAARLVIVVRQVSPKCRDVRRFTVRGHKGRNRVRLSARGLDVGTYRVSASTTSGRLVHQTTVVVLADTTPTRAQIATARAANVCASSMSASSAASTSGSIGAAGGTPPVGAFAGGNSAEPGGVLGSTVAEAARAIKAWLVALLAFAIAVLTVASVPQLAGGRDSHLNEMLARHRIQFVAVGAAALAAAIVVFLLG
jgi:hypothetical protein